MEVNIAIKTKENKFQTTIKKTSLYLGYVYTTINAFALMAHFQNNFGSFYIILFNFAAGLFMISYGKGTLFKRKETFICINNKEIKYKLSQNFLPEECLSWNELESINLYPDMIIFFLKNGKKKQLELTLLEKKEQNAIKKIIKQEAKSQFIKMNN